jgi:2-iminobutanoate/2-iminopropanoate deaminase
MPQEVQVIQTSDAPAAIGPYSQGLVVPAGELIFTAGQIGLDPATGEMVPGGTLAEFRRVMENLRAVLRGAGSDLDRVVKTALYFADLNDFADVNRVYSEYFVEPYPARSAFQAAALPKGARIEMEVIARL